MTERAAALRRGLGFTESGRQGGGTAKCSQGRREDSEGQGNRISSMAGGRQRCAAAGGIVVKAGLWVQLTVGIVFMLWPMPCAHQLNTQLEDGEGKVQLDRLLNVYPALLAVFIVE